MIKKLIMRVVFWDMKKKVCWRVDINISKIRLDEILTCVEHQYQI